jgi:hypothetical protein
MWFSPGSPPPDTESTLTQHALKDKTLERFRRKSRRNGFFHPGGWYLQKCPVT